MCPPRGQGRGPGLGLADLDSIPRLADHVLARDDGLDVLVNNAGVMGVPYRQVTARASSSSSAPTTWATSPHRAAAGRLLARPGSRVITVSSVTHQLGRLELDDLNSQRRYRRWQVSSNATLANALCTLELDRRLRARERPRPAWAPSRLQPHRAAGERASTGRRERPRQFRGVRDPVGRAPAARGALPVLRAATDPEVTGGDYLGRMGSAALAGGRSRPPTPIGRSRNS